MHPVLVLPLNEGSGDIVYDRSGYNNHGTCYNTQWIKKWRDWLLYFNGENAYIEVPDSPSLDITDEITLSAWVYPLARQAVYDRDGIIIKGGAYYLTITPDGYVAVYFYGLGSPGYHIGTIVVPLYQWSLISTTYKSTTGKIRIYVNNTLDREISTSGKIAISDRPLAIGSEWTGGSRFLNGYIGSALVCRKALSADQIAFLSSLFRGEKRSPPVF